MKPRFLLFAVAVILFAPAASAQFGTEAFTEDFEDCFPGDDPEQTWYTYRDPSDLGACSADDAIGDDLSLRVRSPSGQSVTDKVVDFNLVAPAALSSTTFFVRGEPIANTTGGSNQFVAIESTAPRRSVAEFYVFCDVIDAPDGCEFRVRFEQADTHGQVLVNATQNETQFKVRMVFDWFEGTYRLFVDDVDDGVFPFLELPSNIQRVQIGQAKPSSGLNATFDDWTVNGAFAEPEEVVAGDAAEGIKNFLTNIQFTSTGSLFLFGVVLLIIMLAAVIVPLLALGRDNTVVPAVGFFAVLSVLWLIQMEIFPDWIGITLIIVTSALVGLVLRRVMLGIRDANTGPGLVAGSLGYFIIATTLLGLSGYAGENIFLPVDDLGIEPEADDLPENETVEQGFVESVLDCSVGIITFGTLGDCDRSTEGSAVKWVKTTADSIARVTATIFSYGKAAFTFVFQLLTFQLPIPVVFNMIIVLPPAASLAAYGLQIIRGVGG